MEDAAPKTTAATLAETVLPTTDLSGDLAFFGRELGFRLETIMPADDPRTAVMTGQGTRIRLEVCDDAPATLILRSDTPTPARTSPGGTRLRVEPLTPQLIQPETAHAFAVRRLADEAPWVIGRAGMQYRDLIPGRLGGSIIASHIRIPDGGPVPDMVHYHTVGFQLIFCYRGWVDLVYEDQGPPFRLEAGNCVIQPPEIRHRVLYASDNIEVIEIGVPSEHVTTIDHEMELPNDTVNPDRLFQGQRFVHHEARNAEWRPARQPGFIARDTTIAANTGDVAGVQVLHRGDGDPTWTTHNADIHFTFVMEGRMTLEAEGHPTHQVVAGDAFTLPPGLATRYAAPSADIELLEVTLPGSPHIERP
ncbi:cupin domain-containing protein [Aestuariibius sp. 2305UL40-4]|uniref:cupin domain-containing protein n=1 Tax=Aestuariibius violaceus TaxID=3234132 RepID=UPI00345E7CF6